MITNASTMSADPMNMTTHEMTMTDMQRTLTDLYLIVMGMFVYLMQAGFSFLEAGNARYQSVTDTLFRNFLGSVLSCMAYFICGYAFSFGKEPNSNSFIGYDHFALSNLPENERSLFFFEYVFAAATTSIVSGAIADKCNVRAYFVYSLVVPGIIYSIATHWTWSEDGWLKTKLWFNGERYPYQDWAGSGPVHVSGGTCAFFGALILGRRIGQRERRALYAYFRRSSSELPPENRGNSARVSDVEAAVAARQYVESDVDFRGHSVPLATLGGFLLMFGFFGFNGGSLLKLQRADDGPTIALTVVNTALSAAASGSSCAIFYRIFHKRWSVVQAVNGALAGAVAICSGCNLMYHWSAAATGFVAGIVYLFWTWLVPLIGVDDPLETVALHLGGGSWGCVSTAFFSNGLFPGSRKGIFFGQFSPEAFTCLLVQLIGLVSIMAWAAALSSVMFFFLRWLK